MTAGETTLHQRFDTQEGKGDSCRYSKKPTSSPEDVERIEEWVRTASPDERVPHEFLVLFIEALAVLLKS